MEALFSFKLKFLDLNLNFVQKYTNDWGFSSKLLHFLEKNVAFKIKKVNLKEKGNLISQMKMLHF